MKILIKLKWNFIFKCYSNSLFITYSIKLNLSQVQYLIIISINSYNYKLNKHNYILSLGDKIVSTNYNSIY